MTATVSPGVAAFPRRMPAWVRIATPPTIVLALGVVALLPQGENPGAGESFYNPETQAWEFRHDFSTVELAGISTGIASGYLLLASPLLAFRSVLRFVPARWRLGIHRRMGAAILALALLHGAVLPFVGFRRGWLSGLVALLLLGLHGLSGVLKARLARAWGGDAWRYLHLATAWSALAFALFHSFLSGEIAHRAR